MVMSLNALSSAWGRDAHNQLSQHTCALPAAPQPQTTLPCLLWGGNAEVPAVSVHKSLHKIGDFSPSPYTAALKLSGILSNKALYFPVLSDEEFGA